MNAQVYSRHCDTANSTPFGCRSRRIGNSSRIRGCWRAPRACTTTTPDGREVLDGVAGLWCVNAGHGRREITEAVTKQLSTMEYAPAFQMGHPIAFELANRLAKIAPPGLDRIFFTNSGSESVDTALKIAIAYHRARGAGQRTRLIGREKGYHGVGFGGMSVGGMVNNRKFFGSVDAAGRGSSAAYAGYRAQRLLARHCRSGARISRTNWSA